MILVVFKLATFIIIFSSITSSRVNTSHGLEKSDVSLLLEKQLSSTRSPLSNINVAITTRRMFYTCKMLNFPFRGNLKLMCCRFFEKSSSKFNFCTKILKFEVPMLSWIFVWFIFALGIPLGIFAYFWCASNNQKQTKEETNWANVPSTFFSYCFMILIFGCVILMLASNEQLSKTAALSTEATDTILDDVENFIKNTKLEITSLILSSLEIGMNEAQRDLEGVEELLGKPLMDSFDVQTGILNVTLVLNKLKIATKEISARVSDLLKDCDAARNLGKSLEKNLIELFGLLTLARQKCYPRDQALCDTLQISTLNVTFRVDDLLQDDNLQMLKELKKDEDFDIALNSVSQTYRRLSSIVAMETAVPRAEIKKVLASHGNEIRDAVQKFENVAEILLGNVSSNADIIKKVVGDVAALDYSRWLVILILSMLIFTAWCLLMCGMPCGSGLNGRMSSLLLIGLGLISLLSLLIWFCGGAAFIIGSHGRTLICNQLYDEPKFTVLDFFFKEKTGLHLKSVLRDCEINRPAYRTFRIKSVVNVDLLNHEKWNDLEEIYSKFNFNLTADFVSLSLDGYFVKLGKVLELNMTEYRLQTSKVITNHELPLLGQQIERVGKRIKNYRTILEMDVLSKRAKKLGLNDVPILEEYRDRIFYKMAEVEIMMEIYSKQIRESMTGLSRIETFVKTEEWTKIVQKGINDYLVKLKNYLLDVETYIKHVLNTDVGKCKPLWDAFNATRTIFCKMAMEPLNGFTLACFVSILLFLGLAPLIIQIVAHYKIMEEDSFDSITHRRARNGLLIDDEGTWVTPSPTRSNRNPSVLNTRPSSEQSWNVQQPSPTPLIPLPLPHRFPQRADSRSSISISPMKTALHAARILNPSKLLQYTSRIAESPPLMRRGQSQREYEAGTSRSAWDRYESLKSIQRVTQARNWL